MITLFQHQQQALDETEGKNRVAYYLDISIMIHLENDSKFRYIALLSLWERKDHWGATQGSMVRGIIPIFHGSR